jgi:predicted regulator of Ras-like GTPase activity (Roadblock/LC7/MglB family)
MNFNTEIDALLDQVPGAQSAALMGFDGLPVVVRERVPAATDLPTWLTEYAQTLAVLRRAAAEVPAGGTPTDLVIYTPVATVLLRPVHSNYFLAVVQTPQAPAGRARFYMETLALALRHEL